MTLRSLAGLVMAITAVVALATWIDRSAGIGELRITRPDAHAIATPDANKPWRLVGLLAPAQIRAQVTMSLDGGAAATDRPWQDGRLSMDVPALAPGLHRLTWSTRYADRWRRDVTLGWIQGPFVGPESRRCNARVTLTNALLDDGQPGQAGDLADALQPAVARLVQAAVDDSGLQRVHSVGLRLALTGEGVRATCSVDLGHDGRFRVHLDLRAALRSGGVRIRMGERPGFDHDDRFRNAIRRVARQQASWLERLGGGLLELLGEDVFGDEGIARVKAAVTSVSETVPPRLQDLLRTPGPFDLRLPGVDVPVPVQVAPCGDLKFRAGKQVSFNLRLQMPGGASDKVPGLNGPIALAGGMPDSGGCPEGQTICALVSPDLVNGLLYSLWHTGALRGWLERPAVLSAINDALTDLAFRVTTLDPRLPPQIEPKDDGYRLHVEELEAGLHGGGRIPDRHALLGGRLRLLLRTPEDAKKGFLLAGEPTDMALSCRATTHEGEIRGPCLSDLRDEALELAPERIELAPAMALDARLAGWLDRLRPAGAGEGLKLQAGPLAIRYVGRSPRWLHAGAKVRIGGGRDR